MTVIVAAHGKDFVVLATDTRGTYTIGDGARVEFDDAVKTFEVGKYIAVMIAGDGDYAANLMELFVHRYGTGHVDVRDAAEHLAEVCRQDAGNINRFLKEPHFRADVAFIITGLDHATGVPVPKTFRLVSESNYGLELAPNGRSMDGKTTIPLFVFRKAFRPEMSVEELSTLVALAISETHAVDSDVGWRIQMALIRSDGIKRLKPAEVEDITASASLRVVLSPEEDEAGPDDDSAPEAEEGVSGGLVHEADATPGRPTPAPTAPPPEPSTSEASILPPSE